VLEGGIRVPAIVRWPAGLPAGCRVDAMTHFTDWLPTLLGIVGEHVPGELDIDGIDVLPILRGEDARGPSKRFWQWNRYEPVANCNAAMRDGPWKLYRAPIPEAMRKAPGDTDRTFFLVEHPEEVADICRDPLPERDLSPPGSPVLYNLDEDPGEKIDLADRCPERTASMQRQLDQWFAQVEADRRSISDP
jgi:arylsulfatase A-like enzyme